MQKITIFKNVFEKYGFSVWNKNIQIFESGYIYDDIFSLENKYKDFNKYDLIQVKKDNKYGIFNAWTLKTQIPIEYSDIRLETHHLMIVFVCITESGLIYLYDIEGNILNEGNPFDEVMYYGFFETNNKYLFLFKTNNKVGMISTSGNIVIEPSSNYYYEYYRRGDYIILKNIILTGEEVVLYNIFGAHGILLYENIEDYEFLDI